MMKKDTFLSITAYFIIPVYTFLFASNYSWIKFNFSVLGSLEDRRTAFIVWGIIVGLYLHYILKEIINLTTGSPIERKGKFVVLTLLFFTITTPYLPNTFPFISVLHIWFAMLMCVCLMFLILTILFKYRHKHKLIKRYIYLLFIIGIISIILLILLGFVSSALEIFITISVTLFLQRLKISLNNIK